MKLFKTIMTIWGDLAKGKAERSSKERRKMEIIRTGDEPHKWKYFREDEVEGLVVDLVHKLDRAREYYGHPIIINSGFRTPEQNDLVGGHPKSYHLEGMAADIKAPSDPQIREKLVWALGRGGFEHIVSYQKHFHLELDYRNPTPSYSFGTY